MRQVQHHEPIIPPSRRRRTGVLLLLTAALAVSGCTKAADPSPPREQPSSRTVTLRVATNDGPDSPTGAALEVLRDSALELSDGTLQIQPVWEAAGADPRHWDQEVASTVIDGELELGFVPARAFDELGVTTLQPLQAPFLLTSTERVNAVVRSPVVDDLMRGLEEIGLVGLGLYPDDLRRVFSYGPALTSPAAFEGGTVRAPLSAMTAAVFAAVGAHVDDPSGDEWLGAVETGKVVAAESSFAQMAALGSQHPRSTTSGNLVLFPKVNVLVVNSDAFAALDEEQRGLLREVAAAVLDVGGWGTTETQAAEAFCANGGRVTKASPQDLRRLRGAMAGPPPLRVGPARALTAELREIVEGMSALDPVPSCGASD